MKGYKVTDSSRMRMFGVACENLTELIAKGSARLGIQEDVYLTLDDGTIIDDEDYFKMVQPQSIIIFYRKTETVVTGAEYILNILRKINTEYLSSGEKAQEFISKKTDDLVKLLQTSYVCREVSSKRDEDPDWFVDLETNASTKEEYMFRKSQDRIKGYFYKFRGDVLKTPAYLDDAEARKELNNCIEYFRGKLHKDEYFGCFFDRRCARTLDKVDAPRPRYRKVDRGVKKWLGEIEVLGKETHISHLPTYDRLSYCDERGKFVCQGKWNLEECEFGPKHAINPYINRESRILFSIWNLDHRVEKSRTVIPTLIEAIQSRRCGLSINYDYFYQLLFTNLNLKLVHIVCHDKTMHDIGCDMKCVFKGGSGS